MSIDFSKVELRRQLTLTELDMAVEWAAAEGSNPGQDDAQQFWQADPHGRDYDAGRSCALQAY